MIVVTGATGQLGRLVIEQLLEKLPAQQIVAAVRSPDKAADLKALGVQVRQADYNQPATLDSALQGAEKVLLVSSSEVGQRLPQHQAVIDAAQRAGTALLVYTSLLHADRSPLALGEEHAGTERYLQASGVPFVVLRNGWYTENYAAGIPTALQLGSLYGAAGEGRISSASRADYAAAAAAVLLTAQPPIGEHIELGGDTSYTLAEFAAEAARLTGQPLPYVDLPQADYQAALLKAGLPAIYAELLADSDVGAAQGGLFDDSRALSRLIGRPTTPWQQTLASALQG
ncbi:SDR family oxidoreductase [uncultured Pseudomonas sp.]|uniref:SDR family oxidoreductase n=1 Tax=uncultured Pseudomonas sp. TaxID=114707 RepID=UPI0025FDDD0D|nr:SDR family oxidoreductase [uncultured Pseudomonas sp.]